MSKALSLPVFRRVETVLQRDVMSSKIEREVNRPIHLACGAGTGRLRCEQYLIQRQCSGTSGEEGLCSGSHDDGLSVLCKMAHRLAHPSRRLKAQMASYHLQVRGLELDWD